MEQEQKEATEASHTDEVSGVTQEVTQKAKPRSLFFFAGVAVVVLVFAGLYAANKNKNINELTGAAEVTGGADVSSSLPAVVATIDGVELTAAEYQKYYNQAAAGAQQQGVDLADPAVAAEVTNQALEIAVNTQLLMEAAIAADYAASPEMIDSELKNIEGQFESSEAFVAELVAVGVTLEDLRTDVAMRLTIDAYLQANLELKDLSVTPEEVENTYNEFAVGNAEMPPLEAVAATIEQQILTTKQQAATQEIIQALRAEAEIEILI